MILKNSEYKRTPVQQFLSVKVKELNEISETLLNLKHTTVKGVLKELFVAKILKLLLTKQFDIGSGIIINQNNITSNQMDIIIYDNRILLPLIEEHGTGIYPAESVIATIEVKSRLTGQEIKKAEKSTRRLYDEVYKPESSLYKDYDKLKPICAIIGFRKYGLEKLTKENDGRKWLNDNDIKYLTAICRIGKYSWIKMSRQKKPFWVFRNGDRITNEETKRFIAVLIDNIRKYGEVRYNQFINRHRDFVGIYTRDQGDLFKN